MPGFFITNTEKVPVLRNYDDNRCFQGELKYGTWVVRWNALDKFREDKIFKESEDAIIVLDGVILNKQELIKKYKQDSWFETICFMYHRSEIFFSEFRGCFSGAYYDKEKDKWIFFADQIGNHLLLFYYDGVCLGVGGQLNYIGDWMQRNNISKKVSKFWENDFFSYGYMLDVYTIIEGVERVFPGCYLKYSSKHKQFEKIQYYHVKKSDELADEGKIVDLLNNVFSNAVCRVIKKNREYGYKTVMDISGGLDSRMIATVAVRCGNADEFIGINYAQSQTPDQKIALQVANALNINLYEYFMDGGDCLKEIDDLVFMNQGMNYYAGITGGKRMLELLDRADYGAELWGILGDIYDGAMIIDKDVGKLDWNYPKYQHTGRFRNENTYERAYYDNEIMWFYIRGMLCGQNTAFIRQNFVEAPAVYGDIEFMELIFSIPYDIRVRKHIYRKWMIEKYGKIAEIPCTHTGVKVIADEKREFLIAFSKKLKRRMERVISKSGYEKKYSMNPMNYWLENNKSLTKCLDDYFKENIHYIEKDSSIYPKIRLLYDKHSNAMEKLMAITALSAYKQFIIL